MTHLIALTSKRTRVHPDELQAVAAALNKQVQRDFAPAWGIQASVAAFTDPAKVPVDYWPVTVADDIHEPGAAGYHSDEHGQPYALIEYSPEWSVTASHEVVEALGDPFGRRLIAVTLALQRVRLLVELADPCEAYTYPIDSIQVSDFLLPGYYQTSGREVDFLGKLHGPLAMGEGGYFSYLDAGRHWHQETWFSGPRPIKRSLGADKSRPEHRSLRSWVDQRTMELGKV